MKKWIIYLLIFIGILALFLFTKQFIFGARYTIISAERVSAQEYSININSLGNYDCVASFPSSDTNLQKLSIKQISIGENVITGGISPKLNPSQSTEVKICCAKRSNKFLTQRCKYAELNPLSSP